MPNAAAGISAGHSTGTPKHELAADAGGQLELLRAAAESTADAIFLHDRDGRVVYANHQAERLFGWRRQDISGRSLHELILSRRRGDSPAEQEGSSGAPGLVLSEPLAGYRTVFFRRDGSPVEVECTNAPVIADGQVRGAVLTVRDATERNRVELAVRKNERRLTELVGTLDCAAVMVRDPRGTIRLWSHGCEHLYGYTAREALGRRAGELLHTRFPGPPAEIEAALAAAGEWTGDLLQRRNGGSEIAVATRQVLQRDADGHPVSVTESHVDVTSLRGAQARLQRRNRELEERLRVEVAAREAAQDRAAHAERMQALGRLAGGIAHDFNNVLQAVAGGAALIERRPTEDQSVRRYARLILDAAERGAATARRLLAFARRGGLEVAPVAPAALLEGLRDVLAHTLGAAIEIRIEIEAGLPPIMADKPQLETALVNLATNARDAMVEGGRVTFAAEAEMVAVQPSPVAPTAERARPVGLRPGRYVRISVTDTGRGMNPDMLARAAEPFFTSKDTGKGTGLGLAMVKGFAEQSGGAFWMASVPGSGTTASLWIPVAEAPGAQEAAVEEDAFAERAPLRILLVDDEPDVREILAAQLERMGHTVVATPSADAALAALELAGRPDALVTDLTMPGMNGAALIGRAQERYPGLPAILITGLPGEPDALPTVQGTAGPVAMLRKPIAAARLASTLGTVLQR